jgi:hypothetical protein
MLGSLTAPGRVATCDNAAARVAFRFGNIVGTRDLALSRLKPLPTLRLAPRGRAVQRSQLTLHLVPRFVNTVTYLRIGGLGDIAGILVALLVFGCLQLRDTTRRMRA